jgi:hypothetical protein
MYRRLGWLEVGVVQNHSLAPIGVLAPTTIFCKDLRASVGTSGSRATEVDADGPGANCLHELDQ